LTAALLKMDGLVETKKAIKNEYTTAAFSIDQSEDSDIADEYTEVHRSGTSRS
jgi:hypothetical protein